MPVDAVVVIVLDRSHDGKMACAIVGHDMYDQGLRGFNLRGRGRERDRERKEG